MPSPIAHSIAGYALSRLPFMTQKSSTASVLGQDSRSKGSKTVSKLKAIAPLLTFYGIFVSNLPDLDFLPQIVIGLNVHRGPSHSLIAAFLVSAIFTAVLSQFRLQISHKVIFGLTLLFYGSHLLLDLFTSGGSGLPLLWPLSVHEFRAPFPLFPPVHHSRGLWDKSHLVFIVIELLYAGALLTGLRRLKQKSPTRRQPFSH